MFTNKVVLITGGTGSWGQVLTKRLLLESPKEIRIVSRNELAQVDMARKFDNRNIKYIIGDVRDYVAMDRAMKDVDYVFHLAALKHVPICELQPREAILTNINGTENIINVAIKNNVKKVIDVSTDKAVSPYNLYGMSKAIGEKLIINANLLTDKTKFVCVRGGNVIGSNGSVIPFFINQINKFNRIPITDKNMTRYFISLDEAIDLLIKAAKISIGGEILVMNMKSCKMLDLAMVLKDAYGNELTEIKEVGIREGEKIHEELISEHEASNSYIISSKYYLIKPNLKLKSIEEYYNNFVKYDKVKFKSFNSMQNLMSLQDIRNKLIETNFIKKG